jgi:hypothetical protein
MTPVEDRIAALEATVADLRAQLEGPRRRDSMRNTLTCPCCGGGRIIGVAEILESKQGGLVPLAIGNEPGFWRAKRGVPLQAYICRSCLYVEWHIASLEQLVPDGKTIIEMNRPDEQSPHDTPYR